VHAANRGDNISIFFVNNAIYGMTGGQMAPTTLPGQKTTTTTYGRDVKLTGGPIKMSEMLAVLDGPAYIERVSLSSPPNIIRAEQAVKKAFECQMRGLGFSLIEVLSACPTNWRMGPTESQKWIDRQMTRYFPLGVYKDVTKR
jgi:2-oxoglutarate ferredoxin oxidoreductase subunit beta